MVIDYNMDLGFGMYGYNNTIDNCLGETEIIRHTDGFIELSFRILEILYGSDCLGWDTRSECPLSIKGYAHGRSNPENTRLDLKVEWIDCKDVVLDVGTIHLWKE